MDTAASTNQHVRLETFEQGACPQTHNRQVCIRVIRMPLNEALSPKFKGNGQCLVSDACDVPYVLREPCRRYAFAGVPQPETGLHEIRGSRNWIVV